MPARRRPLTPELVALGAGLDEVRSALASLDPDQRAEAERAWSARAVCRGPDVDRSAFFPPGDNALVPASRASMYDRARPICEPCPVWRECLAAGINEPYGFRGRATPSERRLLRRARGERAPSYLSRGR